ncbi:hypothetical protein [Taklimakanibacter deserti]|uniref:hypothetical protein n=1 Tax=Taklimakanibacter deserti TaxID=2267839 RepID=UPI000E650AB1
MDRSKKTPEAVAYAKLLHKQGLCFKVVGERLGIAAKTARAWIDDEFGESVRQQNRAYNRKQRDHFVPKSALWSEPEVNDRARPTLVHIRGIEPSERYSTIETKLRNRRDRPHGAIKRPREMFVSNREARLVHLGRGKVMME